jgi:hypothetical protein
MGGARTLAGGVALALTLTLACTEPRPEGELAPDDAIAVLGRHRSEFERFEDWARRTAAADSTFRGASALDEVAFSPIRRDGGIALARIDREGDGDLHLVHPRNAVLAEDVVYTRVVGGDGIEVARASVTNGDDTSAAEVLARSRTLDSGATLRVTVAFVD